MKDRPIPGLPRGYADAHPWKDLTAFLRRAKPDDPAAAVAVSNLAIAAAIYNHAEETAYAGERTAAEIADHAHSLNHPPEPDTPDD